jgi:LuxR family maltose regulon positive regulatory protein
MELRMSRNLDSAQAVGTAYHFSKFCAPRSASALIERMPLVQRIELGLDGKLVVLLAPLGSGKTTLLNQWFVNSAARRRVAWLLCDERDNDPARFFACLATAIGRAVSEFDARISSSASPAVQCSSGHIADVLLDRLRAIGQELTIIIDDFQWITDAGLNRAFSSLLLHSAPAIHWVVASRHVPRFDLGRLKLEDQLMVIGSADLNFGPEHIRDLARLLHGVELSSQDAAYCCQRTEGWIAGVKLALLSAGQQPGLGLRRFNGSNHDIVTYLADAVLEAQPPAVREFLLATCVVDRMSGELCNALPGIDNAAAMLDDLERSQLFIQPIDSERCWFRYHALFLEFLRNTLRRDAPQRAASLHKIASLWFADHELAEEALHHAFATGERDWCLELISRCVPAWLRGGEFAEVQQWTAQLSIAEIVSCPAIRTAHFMSLIFSRQFERAGIELQAAERIALQSPTDSPESWPENSELQRMLAIYRLMLAIMTDAATELTVQEVHALSLASDPYLTANLLNVSAYYMLVKKRFDAARRLALRGQELLRTTNHVYTEAQSAIVLVLVDRAEGYAKEAADGCLRLYARTKDGRRNPIWVTAATAAASVHYHHNSLQQAETLCAEILPLLAIAPSMENFTVAHLTAARLKCAAGKHGEALRLLDHLHCALESSEYKRLLAQVCFEKVRIWLQQDQRARAMAVLADFGISGRFNVERLCQAGAFDEAWEQFALSQVAILIHRGAFENAVKLLRVLRQKAAADGYVYGHIRLEAMLATCHWYAHDERSTFSLINHALALAQNRGFSRAALDEVSGLPLVFATAVRRAKVATLPPAKYFDKFQDVLACDPYHAAAVAAPYHSLTQRELDLLKLVSQGLSNRDISERCNITLFTTKWHLKNVFAKLGVSTRMEAVFRAQELQLVDGQPPFVSAH